MNQDVLDEARARRDALMIELQELEQFVSLYTKLFAPRDNGSRASEIAAHTTTVGNNVRIKRRNDPQQIADMAANAIILAKRPLQRGELVDLIERRGVQIYSEDKPRYIGTILWRNADRFENVEGKGYRVKRTPESMGLQSLFAETSES